MYKMELSPMFGPVLMIKLYFNWTAQSSHNHLELYVYKHKHNLCRQEAEE